MQLAHLLSPIPVLFANLGSAVGLLGAIRRITDLGPAPGIEVVSDNVIWRPRGGRQKLWLRNDAQSPVQSLTAASALVSPTFPAGLMQVGFSLLSRINYSTPGIGTATRTVWERIGAVGSELTNPIIYAASSTTSNAVQNSAINTALDVLALNGVQRRTISTGTGTYQLSAASIATTSVNFSAAWNISLSGLSAAETAVAILTSTWAANVATHNATAHTLAVGDKTVVAGVTPADYNGTFTVATVPDANSFTVALVISDPGAGVGGTSSRISNVTINSIDVDLVG